MGIVQAVKDLLDRESIERAYFADWTKRLFDAQGNEIELKEFVKLHYMAHEGRWAKQQFETSGFYWLLFASDDNRARGLWLLQVTVGRKGGNVNYIVRDFTTAEETLHNYEAHTNINNRPLRVPHTVRSATLEIITDRV